MNRKSILPVLFSVVMLIFVFFLCWYLPAVGQRRFLLNEIQEELKTSQGRERKQQYEYDETVAAIPEAEAELERVLPLSEAAQQEVRELKQERKKLREEKKKLNDSPSGNQEVKSNE